MTPQAPNPAREHPSFHLGSLNKAYAANDGISTMTTHPRFQNSNEIQMVNTHDVFNIRGKISSTSSVTS